MVLGMGDGSMTTLIIADPEKEGIVEYLKSLPSRWQLLLLAPRQEPAGRLQGPHSRHRCLELLPLDKPMKLMP